MSRAKLAWRMLGRTLTAWFDDGAASMGASLSYFTLFSIAPLLLIVVAVAGTIYGREAVQGRLVAELGGLTGLDTAEAVQKMLVSAKRTGGGPVAAVIGAITLLLGATSVLAELQSCLDRIWRSPAPPTMSTWWAWIRTRLLAFSLILCLAFLLLVSLAVSAALTAAEAWVGTGVGLWAGVLQGLNLVVSFGVAMALFAMIYKLLPREHLRWADVLIGAAVTAGLFGAGKYAIGAYLGHSAVVSTYGAAGSLVLLLLWVYYSAQILLLGAEFTWVYTYTMGSRAVQPEPAEAPTTSAPAGPRA